MCTRKLRVSHRLFPTVGDVLLVIVVSILYY